ncbi:MAG: hypothetical protein JWQ44_262 [Chthoniobacter sp.]|jgi:hypothetical protein|nr:hypothetical protein [Chthoniobacter sp.]
MLVCSGARTNPPSPISTLMKTLPFVSASFAAAALWASVATTSLHAQEPEKINQPNAISGTMDIDFRSRKSLDDKGRPAKGAADQYTVAMNVAQTTEFKGTIQRLPSVAGFLGTEAQKGQLNYSVDLSVLNPANITQKKTVGKWVGTVPIAANGEYRVEGMPDSPLRIAVDAIGKTQAFTDKFGGKLFGKSKKPASAVTYIRKMAGKEVKVEVKNTDPMRFEALALAMGPAQNYPRATVNGNLDYDYETGNYYTNGIRFNYQSNGKETQDVVTGSIKWVEDPNRESNGKGQYEFNLRWNEGSAKPATTEADAFAKMSDEEAFFAVDNTVPSLTGTVSYEDTMTTVADKKVPSASKVKYALSANQLTKAQVMNFFKLWLICVGPTNDE